MNNSRKWGLAHRRAAAGVLTLLLLLATGCGRQGNESRKYARPVTSVILKPSSPAPNLRLSGVVSSWKTEQIGFEVAGKVLWVLEPGRNIERRIVVTDSPAPTANGSLAAQGEPVVLAEGEPLAQIDPAKYEAALRSANASLSVAKREERVAEIQSQTSVEAEIDSAEADLELAQADFKRMKDLYAQNAISQAELDSARTQLDIQNSRMENLEASRIQSQEQLASAKASVERALQSQVDALRDLENTRLYGSYQGQVSEVHVVPGSIVSAGTPVLTLQMMNPIKVEVEVSAEQSREIQKLRQVPISFQAVNETQPRQALAFVYLVDPAADPVTRTFTVTLLVINEQYEQALPDYVPEGLGDDSIARAEDVWPVDLTTIVVGASERPKFIFEKGSICLDDPQGKYVWVVTNAVKGEQMPGLLEVSKAYIETVGPALPFLGNWEFTPGVFKDPALAARSKELLVAGRLLMPDGERGWDGKTVFVDRGKQWMLRPGDLVTVNVAEKRDVDWYVPAESVYVDPEKRAFLFLVDGEQAKKVEIDITLSSSGDLKNGELIRFSPRDTSLFTSGVEIVDSGVHFLKDEEQINVTETTEFSPTEYLKNKATMPEIIPEATQGGSTDEVQA